MEKQLGGRCERVKTRGASITASCEPTSGSSNPPRNRRHLPTMGPSWGWPSEMTLILRQASHPEAASGAQVAKGWKRALQRTQIRKLSGCTSKFERKRKQVTRGGGRRQSRDYLPHPRQMVTTVRNVHGEL